MKNSEEFRKIKYFILFRLLLCTAILFVGALFLQIPKSWNLAVPFFTLLALLIVLNIPWYLIAKNDLLRPSMHAKIQIYTDLLIEIGIIHFSGGLNSPFIYLPLISILSSAFLISSRSVVIYSISAALLYIAVSILEFYRWLPS